MSHKINNFIWACDSSKNTGEGRLANLFFKVEKIKITKHSMHKLTNKILKYKYIMPFIGILLCWHYFFKKKKIYYINYLPLWNFLIFLLLPPKTILGPITGGAYFRSSLVRKYLFPVLYFVSQIIIIFRYDNIKFSTSLLKNKLFNIIKKKSSFNYVLNALEKQKSGGKKKIDFLIYYRNHKNKKSLFPYLFIKKLIKLGLKIYIVGNYLNIKGVKNCGKISNRKINKYLSKTKFSICSGENIFSFFTLECINNNVKILIDKKLKINEKNLIKNFIKIDYNSNQIGKSFFNNI